MQVFLIVAPVFALIAIGYAGAISRLFSENAHKGIAEYAFSIAIPALLFRTIAVAETGNVEPFRLWASYFGAVIATWTLAALITRSILKRPAPDGAAIAISSIYGNVVMLGIPLALATFGPEAAAPMALILSVHTPLVWLAGTAHISFADRDTSTPLGTVAKSLLTDLARNPIILAIVAGSLWRLAGLGLHPAVDKVVTLLAQSGVPCALVALGASLTSFQIKGQAPTLTSILVLKLIAMPAFAWLLAVQVFQLPPVAAGVVVIFAAMPTGANAYVFAMRYRRVVNSASGAVALGTVLAAVSASILMLALLR